MALTQKQKRFAELVAIGETATAAYKTTYDCGNSTRRTIATEAFRLVHNPDVAAYIAELNEAAAKLTVATREGLLHRLWRVNSIAYDEIADTDNKDRYKAFQAFTKTADQLIRLGVVQSVDDAEQERIFNSPFDIIF